MELKGLTGDITFREYYDLLTGPGITHSTHRGLGVAGIDVYQACSWRELGMEHDSDRGSSRDLGTLVRPLPFIHWWYTNHPETFTEEDKVLLDPYICLVLSGG